VAGIDCQRLPYFGALHLAFLLCLVSCSQFLSSNNDPSLEAAFKSPSPSTFANQLQTEFRRLGIDPNKTAAQAPSGIDNAPFDLKVSAIDPDGLGGNPPTGVSLSWTERLLGDYDQNGEVNVADLAPLALYWNQAIDYESASSHNGFAGWPVNDPDGEGALNWRKARIDGDANGLLATKFMSKHQQSRVLRCFRIPTAAVHHSQFPVQQALFQLSLSGTTSTQTWQRLFQVSTSSMWPLTM
jgi:hypothetical protein